MLYITRYKGQVIFHGCCAAHGVTGSKAGDQGVFSHVNGGITVPRERCAQILKSGRYDTMNMMRYKGYISRIEFDEEDRIFSESLRRGLTT